MSLSSVLRRAGVSRTAYYSLVGKPSVLPGTIHALSAALGTPEAEILSVEEPSPEESAVRRIEEARQICTKYPEVEFESVWHTLCLLDLSPVERLNRSLIRGCATPVY
jgi:hypothetical protein